MQTNHLVVSEAVFIGHTGIFNALRNFTVVMGRKGASRKKPAEFRADHPFLFMIRDLESGAVLFMGRVVDPSAS